MTETTDENQELLQEARERFAYIQETDRENRENQRNDANFVFSPGKQWPEDVKAQRTQWKELCLEFNQLKQFVSQVVNDQRQNRPGIRVFPADGEASQETAEIIQGLIRAIEYDSKAEAVYDNAFQNAVVGGRGWWRIRSEYVDDDGFDQRLVLDPIFDSNTVYADLDYQQPDGSDRAFAFVVQSISKKDFERKYKNAEPLDWDGIEAGWKPMKDRVLIADYYRRICTIKSKALLIDGSIAWEDEVVDKTWIVNKRDVEVYSVEWYSIAGGQQVLEKYDWPGTMIPLVCIAGDDMMMDGKRIYQGLIRNARDAQSMLNFGMTQQAIHLSLTPRAPWIATADQIENYEGIWQDANVKNYSVLPYNHVEGVPPPQRTMPSIPDSGYAQWTETMIAMIRSTIGMYENSLGIKGQETSGRAILARERQGDNATFNFVDNLSRGIALTGRIIIEVLGSFYDTERIVHTIGLDGTRDEVTINQRIPVPDQESGAIQAIVENDVTRGKYSVVSEAGPSYATKRQESADTLNKLAQAYPPLMGVAGDIVVRAQDIPDADAIAERLELTLPPQIQQAKAAKQKNAPQIPPELLQELQQKDEQLQMAAQVTQEMDGRIKQLESGVQEKLQSAEIDASITIQKAKIDAETKIQVALIDRETKLQIAGMNTEAKTVEAIIKSESNAPSPEEMPPDSQQIEVIDQQPPSGGFFTPNGEE